MPIFESSIGITNTNHTFSISKSFQQFPYTRLHPKLRILAMQEREVPWQDPRLLPFGCRVEEETLHMERRISFILVDVHLHGKQTIARTETLLHGRVATPNNDLYTPTPKAKSQHPRHTPPTNNL